LLRRLRLWLHHFLERIMPEKRLFLRTDSETRFVRLSPISQIITILGSAAFVGWAIIATAIVLLDTIGSGNFRDQARRDQAIYENRLNGLASERDNRAQEALAAQQRFNTALEQVSSMQSELLTSEDQRRELERGIGLMQATLRRAMTQRGVLQVELDAIAAQIDPENGMPTDANATQAIASAMDYVNDTLADVSQQRDQAQILALQAHDQMASLKLEIQFIEEKGDQIFRQLEDAMTISVKPLDKMFRNAGLNTDRLLEQIKRGYSGQGGALSPISYMPGGGLDVVDPTIDRANNILNQLDKLNIYRIAAEKAPFAMPVKGTFRFTSGYGPRWGQMHRGTDFAAKSGSPIYATADGVVTRAEWGGGYGRVVYIKHAFGIETRYAHMAKIRVKKGQRVSRGQRIGDMGNSGRSTGTHLHYEVRVNGKDVNPMIYIKAGRDVF
jgi:murein DD-endopeptidase MepM/ murein hydrolase activator NlpD